MSKMFAAYVQWKATAIGPFLTVRAEVRYKPHTTNHAKSGPIKSNYQLYVASRWRWLYISSKRPTHYIIVNRKKVTVTINEDDYMDTQILRQKMEMHAKWLDGADGGERLVLIRADLRGSDLSGSNLRDCDIRYCDLSVCDLRGSDLSVCDLRGSDLSVCDLRGSDLSGSNLRYCDLSVCDLRGCDLSDCDLRWCIGNAREIKSMQLDKWPVVYTHDTLCIGCQQHKITDWWSFTDEQINKMAGDALEWWKIWKPVLQHIISLSPATPTGHESA